MEKTAITVAQSFSEYGLIGLVMFALLGMMFFFGRWFARHMEQMASMHRDERSEWLDTVKEVTKMQDARQQETNVILQDLTRVIEGRLFQGAIPSIGRKRK